MHLEEDVELLCLILLIKRVITVIPVCHYSPADEGRLLLLNGLFCKSLSWREAGENLIAMQYNLLRGECRLAIKHHMTTSDSQYMYIIVALMVYRAGSDPESTTYPAGASCY